MMCATGAHPETPLSKMIEQIAAFIQRHRDSPPLAQGQTTAALIVVILS